MVDFKQLLGDLGTEAESVETKAKGWFDKVDWSAMGGWLMGLLEIVVAVFAMMLLGGAELLEKGAKALFNFVVPSAEAAETHTSATPPIKLVHPVSTTVTPPIAQPVVPAVGQATAAQPVVPAVGQATAAQPVVPAVGQATAAQPAVPAVGQATVAQPAVPAADQTTTTTTTTQVQSDPEQERRQEAIINKAKDALITAQQALGGGQIAGGLGMGGLTSALGPLMAGLSNSGSLPQGPIADKAAAVAKLMSHKDALVEAGFTNLTFDSEKSVLQGVAIMSNVFQGTQINVNNVDPAKPNPELFKAIATLASDPSNSKMLKSMGVDTQDPQQMRDLQALLDPQHTSGVPVADATNGVSGQKLAYIDPHGQIAPLETPPAGKVQLQPNIV